MLNGDSGSAKLAIPPATGMAKPSVPERACAAWLASTMSRASARSMRCASAVSQNRVPIGCLTSWWWPQEQPGWGRTLGAVFGSISGEQDQAGEDQGAADSLSRDEGLAQDTDGGHCSGQRLQGEQQARAGGADRADPDVEREQGAQAAEQHGGRGNELVGFGCGDPAAACPPRAQDERRHREDGADELPCGAADAVFWALLRGLGGAARPDHVAGTAEYRREHQQVAEPSPSPWWVVDPASGAFSATRTVPAVPRASAAAVTVPMRSLRKSAASITVATVSTLRSSAPLVGGGAGEAEVAEQETQARAAPRPGPARVARPAGAAVRWPPRRRAARRRSRELDREQVGGPQPVQRDNGERGADPEPHGGRGDRDLPASGLRPSIVLSRRDRLATLVGH